jgi:3-mercaptopyruvate sulfurtransferase SseA
VTPAWPRPLISPAELAARIDAPELRLIECGVATRALPDRSDFRAESARPLYDAGHIPGAVFLDPIGDVSVYDGSLKEWARDPGCPMESGPAAS